MLFNKNFATLIVARNLDANFSILSGTALHANLSHSNEGDLAEENYQEYKRSDTATQNGHTSPDKSPVLKRSQRRLYSSTQSPTLHVPPAHLFSSANDHLQELSHQVSALPSNRSEMSPNMCTCCVHQLHYCRFCDLIQQQRNRLCCQYHQINTGFAGPVIYTQPLRTQIDGHEASSRMVSGPLQLLAVETASITHPALPENCQQMSQISPSHSPMESSSSAAFAQTQIHTASEIPRTKVSLDDLLPSASSTEDRAAPTYSLDSPDSSLSDHGPREAAGATTVESTSGQISQPQTGASILLALDDDELLRRLSEELGHLN